MTGYVLQRTKDGAFVAKPGSRNAYTRSITKAWVFRTADAAKENACGNERVLPIDSFFKHTAQ